jgi:hypothetical protein
MFSRKLSYVISLRKGKAAEGVEAIAWRAWCNTIQKIVLRLVYQARRGPQAGVPGKMIAKTG